MLPLLVILFLGGYVLLAACFILGIMALREFYNGFHEMGVKPSYPIGVASAVVLYGVQLASMLMFKDDPAETMPLFMLWIFLSVLASLLYLFKILERNLADAMATITGIFYVMFFLFHLVLIDSTKFPLLIWLVVISAFGTDIMAYFTGRFLGKRKLCPNISPKKTVAGAVGGAIGSLVLCGIFGLIFAKGVFIHCMIIGLLGGVVSQFGDLTASIFKRKMGIKDYGHLIPGHGGVLDRFDSVLFTGPLVFYYIAIVMQ